MRARCQPTDWKTQTTPDLPVVLRSEKLELINSSSVRLGALALTLIPSLLTHASSPPPSPSHVHSRRQTRTSTRSRRAFPLNSLLGRRERLLLRSRSVFPRHSWMTRDGSRRAAPPGALSLRHAPPSKRQTLATDAAPCKLGAASLIATLEVKEKTEQRTRQNLPVSRVA